MNSEKKAGNRELEYDKVLSYIFHMYDTRHKIFSFAVSINTILLAVVFQYIEANLAKLLLSILAGTITTALYLMNIRASHYRAHLENYAKEVEQTLGFSALTTVDSRMPKGVDSTKYLFFVYFLMSCLWGILSMGYFINVIGIEISMP